MGELRGPGRWISLAMTLAILGCRGDPDPTPVDLAPPPAPSLLSESAARAIDGGTVTLPVATGKGRSFTSTAGEILITPTSISVDGGVVAELVDGQVGDAQRDGDRILPLFDVLQDKREVDRATPRAIPSPLLLVVDSATPWLLFDQVVHTASQSYGLGFRLLALGGDGTRLTIPLRVSQTFGGLASTRCGGDLFCVTVILGESGIWIDVGDLQSVLEEDPPPRAETVVAGPPRWPRSPDGSWPASELDAELRRFEAEYPAHEGIHVHAQGPVTVGQVTPVLSVVSRRDDFDTTGLAPALIGPSARLTADPDELRREKEELRELMTPLLESLGGEESSGPGSPGRPSP